LPDKAHQHAGKQIAMPQVHQLPWRASAFQYTAEFVLLTRSLLNIRAKAELARGLKSARLFFSPEKSLNLPNIGVSAYH
jgi:hypothetical protein